jgi:sterol desaturase/sphingolipid hydroxylase (fatty acid hydroxylase superfamily)
VKKTIVEAAFGQLFLSPLLSFYGMYPLCKYFGMAPLDMALPSVIKLVQTFAIAHVFNETGFYFAHRFLHSYPWLYQAIHKQHHEYIGMLTQHLEAAAQSNIHDRRELPSVSSLRTT